MLGGHVSEGRNDGYQCIIYLTKSVQQNESETIKCLSDKLEYLC